MTNTEPVTITEWHPQQEKILKIWGEQCSCYRWMHYKAYESYKLMSMGFTLPIIILSTVTGTANFALETFPDSWRMIAPVVIGGLNLFAAILTTVTQFLKVNELMESHRVSSIQYGKLSRQIRLHLTLPVYERTQSGTIVIENSNSEYDRLIEQSPPVPNKIIKKFQARFPTSYDILDKSRKKEIEPIGISRPEIINITEILPYDMNVETQVAKKMLENHRRKSTTVQTDYDPPPTTIQHSDPEHVTIELSSASKVNETRRLFEKS